MDERAYTKNSRNAGHILLWIYGTSVGKFTENVTE
jgi:hypothetical protein